LILNYKTLSSYCKS